MDRGELLTNLRLVGKALTTGPVVIPTYGCFCFSGGMVTAYDDLVALQAPAPIGMEGGVEGKLLLSFLASCGEGEVHLKQNETNCEFKVNRARLKMPVRPKDEFFFDFPTLSDEEQPHKTYEVGPGFGYSVDACSVGMNPAIHAPAWQQGVTCAALDSKSVEMFSTDNKTLTRTVLEVEDWPEEPFRLSPRFCKILPRLAEKGGHLYIGDGWVEFVTEDVRLFGKTGGDAHLEAYHRVIGGVDWGISPIEIPDEFDEEVKRSLLVINPEDSPFWITIENQKMNLNGKGMAGEIFGSLTEIDHPDVKVGCNPTYLARALPYAECIRFDETRILLSDASYQHLIAAFENRD